MRRREVPVAGQDGDRSGPRPAGPGGRAARRPRASCCCPGVLSLRLWASSRDAHTELSFGAPPGDRPAGSRFHLLTRLPSAASHDGRNCTYALPGPDVAEAIRGRARHARGRRSSPSNSACGPPVPRTPAGCSKRQGTSSEPFHVCAPSESAGLLGRPTWRTCVVRVRLSKADWE